MKNIFLLIFGFSMVVSHYSTAYLALSLFIFTYLIFLIFRKTEGKKPFCRIYKKLNLKENKKQNNKIYYLSGKIVLLLFVLTFLWNAQFTETSSNFVTFVDKTINAIIEGAKTGQIGDGKIFVVDLPECIRIRTGQRGNKAIG